MAAMFSEKAQAVLSYLQAHQNEQNTAATIAEALGMEKKSVEGTLTGLQRVTTTHPQLIKREKVEGVDAKVVTLTPEGVNADPEAERPVKE